MKLKSFPHPIRAWRVPSKSHIGVYYNVELLSNGEFVCNCPAGVFQGKGRSCRHRKIVKKYIQKQNEISERTNSVE